MGHITCDNVKNNDTMLEEFAHCYQVKMGCEFKTKRQQIRYVFHHFGKCSLTQSANAHLSCRCLAHIINLVMQAVISAHSKAQFCSSAPEDNHIPEDVGRTERDEIGLVHAICVKVRLTPLLSLSL